VQRLSRLLERFMPGVHTLWKMAHTGCVYGCDHANVSNDGKKIVEKDGCQGLNLVKRSLSSMLWMRTQTILTLLEEPSNSFFHIQEKAELDLWYYTKFVRRFDTFA